MENTKKLNLISKVSALNIRLLGYSKVADVIFQIVDTLERLDYIDFEDAIDLEKLSNSVKSEEDAVLLKLSVIDFILNIKQKGKTLASFLRQLIISERGNKMLSIKRLDKEQSKAIEEDDKYFFYKCELSSYITIKGNVEFCIRYSDNELLFNDYYHIQGKYRRIDIVKYMIAKAFEKDLFLKSRLELSKKMVIRYFDNANRITCFEVTL